MTEQQRLFLVQARSAHAVFRLLKTCPSVHHCHALHYLQMATELLGKAYAWERGAIGRSHKALVGFLRNLSSNVKAQEKLGFKGKNRNWTHTIRKVVPIAESLQRMAPALAQNGPNPEYPWPPDAPTTAPVEYTFPIWEELTGMPHGAPTFSVIGNTIWGYVRELL
jgi:hypothetical protein